MSEDTPTQRLPETEGDAGELVGERKKSRALLFTLIGVGAALVITIIVLLVILLGGGASGQPEAVPTDSVSPTPTPTTSDSPTPSATPSDSATPTPTPTSAPPPPPPPPDTSPGFASFSSSNVQCQSPNEGVPVQPVPPQIRFSWSAKNAQSVWFQLGTGDAAASAAFEVPLSGNQDAVYGTDSFPFPCPAAEQPLTLTVVGTNGQHVNQHFTITNTGYRG